MAESDLLIVHARGRRYLRSPWQALGIDASGGPEASSGLGVGRRSRAPASAMRRLRASRDHCRRRIGSGASASSWKVARARDGIPGAGRRASAGRRGRGPADPGRRDRPYMARRSIRHIAKSGFSCYAPVVCAGTTRSHTNIMPSPPANSPHGPFQVRSGTWEMRAQSAHEPMTMLKTTFAGQAVTIIDLPSGRPVQVGNSAAPSPAHADSATQDIQRLLLFANTGIEVVPASSVMVDVPQGPAPRGGAPAGRQPAPQRHQSPRPGGGPQGHSPRARRRRARGSAPPCRAALVAPARDRDRRHRHRPRHRPA